MNPINNNINFGAKYNFTILGKNNPHKPLLFNEISELANETQATTVFKTGKNEINMGVESFKTAQKISENLKKMGIIEGGALK